MMRFNKSLTGAIVAGVLLAACSHGNQSSSSTTTTTTQGSPAAASPAAATTSSPMANGVAASDGATIYQTNCSSCHQASGQGLAGTFPPLAGNPVVTGSVAPVIHIVKDGLTGQISVKGATYNGQMPAWGQTLSNGDIAAVLTYVRSAWGNSASAVTSGQVAATH